VRYLEENGILSVTDHELSSYAYKKHGLSVDAATGGFVKYTDYFLIGNAEELSCDTSFTVKLDGFELHVSTYPERVYIDNGVPTVCLSANAKTLYHRFNVGYNASLVARGVICSRAVSLTYGCDKVRLVLTLVSRDTGDTVSYYRDYSNETLEKMTDALISRASVFFAVTVERSSARYHDIKKLMFPYKDIRSGQHDLMLGIMKTVRRGGKLLASAPTGTGKTMAALYPSIKALGEGFVDRIFYLTGKTVTGKVAFDSMKLLAESAPTLRCIIVHSKERSCAEKNREDSCFTCRRMNECEVFGETLSYEARRDLALSELLSSHTMYDGKLICEYAEKYSLCPYELSLDLSEYCDTVVCDYNYVFDNAVRFRRYFVEDRGEKYAFLIDECHNLPDRVRASYSACVSTSMLSDIEELISKAPLKDPEMSAAVTSFGEALNSIKDCCIENAVIVTDKQGDHTVGFYKSDSAPAELVRAAEKLGRLCRAKGREKDEDAESFKRIASELLALSTSISVGAEGSSFFAELMDGSVKASVVCLDPSAIITKMTECAHAVVMFSATLNPTDYFADMLGVGSSPILKAESPFDKNRLSVTVFDGLSTKLTDRKNTAREIAEVIATVLESREGHYFVFFPSYAYMKTVARELLAISPDVRAVMQKQTMTFADREKFLKAFKSTKFTSIVGLCVLGGAFSEGVDLVGEGLIGVIVVGAGLPGISSELNLMSEYFDNKYGIGRLYAYEYPAINRIEQAAGRVIRSAEDKGVVVLVDDRLSSPEMAERFPDFWPQIACTSDIDTLAVILQRFWSSFEDEE